MDSLRPTILMLMVGLTGLLPAAPQTSKQHEDAEGWFLEIQGQAYDKVMPIDLADLVVTYRFFHESAPATVERYFAIQRIRVGDFTSPNALTATVVTPVGRSVQQQLVALRLVNPEASLDGLLPKLTLKRAAVDGDKCSAIGSQIGRLSDVRLTIPSSDRVILDAPVHQFAVRLGGLKMSLDIQGDDSSVVAWATRTHELLMGCVSRQ